MTHTELKKLLTILLMAITPHALASSAVAEGTVTVFDTGLPDQLGSQQSDRDDSDATDSGQRAVLLEVPDTGLTFDHVRWYGEYRQTATPPEIDEFNFRIFEIDNGLASTTPIMDQMVRPATRIDTVTFTQTSPIFEYQAQLPATKLEPGSYLISLVAWTSDIDDDWHWTTSSGNLAWTRTGEGTAWSAGTGNLSLTLSRNQSWIAGPPRGDGNASDFDFPAQQGDSFFLDRPRWIDWIGLRGSYSPAPAGEPAADVLVVRIFDVSANGGVPTQSPRVELSPSRVSRTATAEIIGQSPVYEYRISFPGIFLDSGQYLISVVNDTSGSASNWYWQQTSRADLGAYSRASDGQAWSATGYSRSFALGMAAAPIHDNDAPNMVDAGTSDTDSAGVLRSADSVEIFAGWQLHEAVWYGVYGPTNLPPAQDDFTVSLYQVDQQGVPSYVPLHSFSVGHAERSDTDVDLLTLSVYRYRADLPATNLDAGRYLFSVTNHSSGTSDNWGWMESDSLADRYATDQPSSTWNGGSLKAASYRLFGSIVSDGFESGATSDRWSRTQQR